MAADCVYWFGIPVRETPECRARRKAQADRNRDDDEVRPFWTVDSDVKTARQDRKAIEAMATGQTSGDRAASQLSAVLGASGPALSAVGAGLAAAAGVPALGGLFGGAPATVAPSSSLEQLIIPAGLLLVVAGVTYAVMAD